jgi:hypothetical protein
LVKEGIYHAIPGERGHRDSSVAVEADHSQARETRGDGQFAAQDVVVAIDDGEQHLGGGDDDSRIEHMFRFHARQGASAADEQRECNACDGFHGLMS